MGVGGGPRYEVAKGDANQAVGMPFHYPSEQGIPSALQQREQSEIQGFSLVLGMTVRDSDWAGCSRDCDQPSRERSIWLLKGWSARKETLPRTGRQKKVLEAFSRVYGCAV